MKNINFKYFFYLLVLTMLMNCDSQNTNKVGLKPALERGLNGQLKIEEFCYDGVIYLVNTKDSPMIKFSTVKFTRIGRVQLCDDSK